MSTGATGPAPGGKVATAMAATAPAEPSQAPKDTRHIKRFDFQMIAGG